MNLLSLRHVAKHVWIEPRLGTILPEFGFRHSRMILAREFRGVEAHSNRVFREIVAAEESLHLLHSLEIVDLELDFVTVRIAIVHRERESMIDWRGRRNARFSEPFIGRDQIAQT